MLHREHWVELFLVILGDCLEQDIVFYANFCFLRLKQSVYSVKLSCLENKLSEQRDFVVCGNCRGKFQNLSGGQNLQLTG